METVSGRIPDDLYQWFATLKIDGAVTNSDKLRELLAQVKRQHEGTLDFVSAQAWIRDLLSPLRSALAELERDEQLQSQVVAQMIEHVANLAAVLVSAQPRDKSQALALEDALVRRVFSLSESLLRQAVTTRASAYDPAVVRRHAKQAIELTQLLV